MASYTKKGDTIEGKRLNITTRKIIFSSNIEIENIGRCFKYLCQINAKASIVEELEIKKSKFCKTSQLNLNDSVHGESIDLYSPDFLKLKLEANATSRHGIQSSETKRYGCAQIRIPFRFALTH